MSDSLNNNQMGIRTRLEAARGVFDAPQSADSDVITWGSGQPTINFGNESQGKKQDGTFNDAPVAGGQQTITFPDMMFNLFHGGGDGTTEPKMWKYFKAGGGKVNSAGTQLAIEWDGTPSCETLSGIMRNLACNGNGYDYTGRGMRGNITIAYTGANAPFVCTLTSLQGAFVAETELTAQQAFAIIGNDAAPKELAGYYTTTIASIVYQIPAFTFNAGFTVSMEPANNESGVATAKLTAQDKRLTMSVLQLSQGDGILNLAKLNTLLGSVTMAGGTGAGYDITFSNCEFLEPSKGEVDGSTVWEIESIVEKASFLMKDLS